MTRTASPHATKRQIDAIFRRLKKHYEPLGYDFTHAFIDYDGSYWAKNAIVWEEGPYYWATDAEWLNTPELYGEPYNSFALCFYKRYA